MVLTNDQKAEVYDVVLRMKAVDLTTDFIESAVMYADAYEGGYDLLMLWRDAGDDIEADIERERIVIDIQELLDEWESYGRP